MKRLIALLTILMTACSTPTQVQTVYNYRDSTIINYKDSTIITPVEKITNITLPDQKSELETSLAASTAFTDSLGLLHHSLENKKDIIYKYIYKDRERIVRDTVRIQVPVEVKVPVRYVPRIYSFTFWGVVVLLLGFVAYLVIKQKGKIIYFK